MSKEKVEITLRPKPKCRCGNYAKYIEIESVTPVCLECVMNHCRMIDNVTSMFEKAGH